MRRLPRFLLQSFNDFELSPLVFRACSVNYNMYFQCMQLDIAAYYCNSEHFVLYHLVWPIVCRSFPTHLLNFVTAFTPYVLLQVVFVFQCY